eukprot:UN04490
MVGEHFADGMRGAVTLGLFLGRNGFGFDFGRNFICCGFFFTGSSSIGNFFAGGSFHEWQKRRRADDLPLRLGLHVCS